MKDEEPGDELLTKDDQKALSLIRQSLGARGYDNAKLLLIREHAVQKSFINAQSLANHRPMAHTDKIKKLVAGRRKRRR